MFLLLCFFKLLACFLTVSGQYLGVYGYYNSSGLRNQPSIEISLVTLAIPLSWSEDMSTKPR